MHSLRMLFRILTVVLVATASLAAVGTAPARAQERVDIAEILDDPEAWIGEEVTVRGDVAEVLSRQAIALAAEEAGESLLVVGVRDVIARSIGEDFTVRVIGTVRMFDPNDPGDWIQEIGIDPEDEVFSEFEDEPVLVADRVRVLAAPDDVTEDDEENVGDDDDAVLGAAERVTIADFVEDPGAFLEGRVTMVGEIGELFEGPAFLLSQPEALTDADVEDVLVVYGDESRIEPSRLNEDALIVVTGTVGEFDPNDPFEAGGSAFEDEEEGIFDDELDEFEGDPVVVAELIRVIAPKMGAVIEEILDDPDEWFGETVTLYGEVNETLSLAGFTLKGTEGFLGITQENLLVIGSPDVIPTDLFLEDVIVQVTGAVRLFDPDDPELLGEEPDEELAILVEGDEFEDFEGEPVIVAESIEVLATEPGETIDGILSDEVLFIDERVTVAGNVNEVLGLEAFTLEGEEGLFGLSEENLLVVGAEGDVPPLTEDTIVFVTGVVLEFDPDEPFDLEDTALDDAGLDDDDFSYLFEDNAFSEFEGDAIIVAERIVPLVVD